MNFNDFLRHIRSIYSVSSYYLIAVSPVRTWTRNPLVILETSGPRFASRLKFTADMELTRELRACKLLGVLPSPAYRESREAFRVDSFEIISTGNRNGRAIRRLGTEIYLNSRYRGNAIHSKLNEYFQLSVRVNVYLNILLQNKNWNRSLRSNVFPNEVCEESNFYFVKLNDSHIVYKKYFNSKHEV